MFIYPGLVVMCILDSVLAATTAGSHRLNYFPPASYPFLLIKRHPMLLSVLVMGISTVYEEAPWCRDRVDAVNGFGLNMLVLQPS